jgi:hypothetical protein
VEVRDRLLARTGAVAGLVAEVDDLDGLARRQDDSADVRGVVGLAAHVVAPDRHLIGLWSQGLDTSTPVLTELARCRSG